MIMIKNQKIPKNTFLNRLQSISLRVSQVSMDEREYWQLEQEYNQNMAKMRQITSVTTQESIQEYNTIVYALEQFEIGLAHRLIGSAHFYDKIIKHNEINRISRVVAAYTQNL